MKYRSFETKIPMKNIVFSKCTINKIHWNQFPVGSSGRIVF